MEGHLTMSAKERKRLLVFDRPRVARGENTPRRPDRTALSGRETRVRASRSAERSGASALETEVIRASAFNQRQNSFGIPFLASDYKLMLGSGRGG